MYTTHGHHIPGSDYSEPPPDIRARCGGVTGCLICAQEARDAARDFQEVISVNQYGEMALSGDQQVRMECLRAAALASSGSSFASMSSVLKMADQFVMYVKTGSFN